MSGKPTKAEAKEIVRAFRVWRPETRPIQFTVQHSQCIVPPTTRAERREVEDELDQDALQPFFSEAYLYNLLGKEDARSLLYRMEALFDYVEKSR